MSSSKIAAGLILLFAAATADGPQTPLPGGPGRGGRGGGGFTQPDPIDFADNTGWTSMFDGSSLKGWDGNMDLWHVENGAITVESTCEKPTGTVYLIWQGGQPGDFELKAELRGEGAGVNSGIQYRSFIQPPRQMDAGRGGAGAAGGAAGGGGGGGGGGGRGGGGGGVGGGRGGWSGGAGARRPRAERGVSQRAAAGDAESGGGKQMEHGRSAGRFRRHQSLQRPVLRRRHDARNRGLARSGGAGGRGQEAAVGGDHRRQGRTRRLRQDQRLEPVPDHRAWQPDDSHPQRARDVGVD